MIFENFDTEEVRYQEETNDTLLKSSEDEDKLSNSEREVFNRREREAYERGFRDGKKHASTECNETYQRAQEVWESKIKKIEVDIYKEFNNRLVEIENGVVKVVMSGLFLSSGREYISHVRKIFLDIKKEVPNGGVVSILCSKKTRALVEAENFLVGEGEISWELENEMSFPDCHFAWDFGSFSFSPRKVMRELKDNMQKERCLK